MTCFLFLISKYSLRKSSSHNKTTFFFTANQFLIRNSMTLFKRKFNERWYCQLMKNNEKMTIYVSSTNVVKASVQVNCTIKCNKTTPMKKQAFMSALDFCKKEIQKEITKEIRKEITVRIFLYL